MSLSNESGGCGSEDRNEENSDGNEAGGGERMPSALSDTVETETRQRVYRHHTSSGDDTSDDNLGNVNTIETGRPTSPSSLSLSSSSPSSTSFSSSDSSSGRSIFRLSLGSQFDADDAEMPRVMLKPRPRHKWFAVNEIVNRQTGMGNRFQGPELFQRRYYGSLHAVQRLELMSKLETHSGCVNSIQFNQSGSLLVSGSDDRKIAVWDWASNKCVLKYASGHSSNVFQAKLLPLAGDCHIVSCSRDGQVRLAVLNSAGAAPTTRCLARHRSPANKLITLPDSPHLVLSAGEDALVLSIDVREPKGKKLLRVSDKNRPVELFSIHGHPLNTNEFCVAGDDCKVRVYDRRMAKRNAPPLKSFCPNHLDEVEVPFIHVTSAVYNFNGTEIISSFSNEAIYLFDTRHADGADYDHLYEGHKNRNTTKSVNFFGPKSEFIVSGSDCGHIFFWEKDCEAIVQWMKGDEEGVVNCLEPHPQMPVIATSGLDKDVKIWVPKCEREPSFNKLKETVCVNQASMTRSIELDRLVLPPSDMRTSNERSMSTRLLHGLLAHEPPQPPRARRHQMHQLLAAIENAAHTMALAAARRDAPGETSPGYVGSDSDTDAEAEYHGCRQQ